ncbi:MAG: M3 family metallopeptidase, partial [Phenylobacterium sp.]
MKRRSFLAASGALAATQALSLPARAAAAASPMTQAWTGPFGGVPAFDKVRVQDFRGAIEQALATEKAEIDAIARNRAPPTFANTIEALELSGQMTARVLTYYFSWTNTLASPEVQKVESDVEPLLAAHQDAILQNAALFRRIDEVYTRGAHAGLTPEQHRLMWYHHNRFVRAGARLTGVQKTRVAAINQELAGLYTSFSQNLLADETDYVLFLRNEAELTGLPDDIRAAAAGAAEARGRKGEWAILNTRSSMDPFLTYSARRDLREKVWRTYYSRGDNGDAKDNNGLIRRILKLRAERAGLLGYPTHAHWRLADTMAGSPDRAMELMMRVWPAA